MMRNYFKKRHLETLQASGLIFNIINHIRKYGGGYFSRIKDPKKNPRFGEPEIEAEYGDIKVNYRVTSQELTITKDDDTMLHCRVRKEESLGTLDEILEYKVGEWEDNLIRYMSEEKKAL